MTADFLVVGTSIFVCQRVNFSKKAFGPFAYRSGRIFFYLSMACGKYNVLFSSATNGILGYLYQEYLLFLPRLTNQLSWILRRFLSGLIATRFVVDLGAASG